MRAFAPDSPPHEYLETRIVRLTKIVDYHTGLELYDSDSGPIGLGGGLPPNAREQEILSVATNGQTAFTLAKAPTKPNELMLTFRLVPRRQGVDFNVAGSTLTFTMPDVTAYAGDSLQVWYE